MNQTQKNHKFRSLSFRRHLSARLIRCLCIQREARLKWPIDRSMDVVFFSPVKIGYPITGQYWCSRTSLLLIQFIKDIEVFIWRYYFQYFARGRNEQREKRSRKQRPIEIAANRTTVQASLCTSPSLRSARDNKRRIILYVPIKRENSVHIQGFLIVLVATAASSGDFRSLKNRIDSVENRECRWINRNVISTFSIVWIL